MARGGGQRAGQAVVQDSGHASAITRALGATPQQVRVGLAAAQPLPASVGAVLGIPGGYLLSDLAKHGGDPASLPSLPVLLAVIAGSAVVVALLTAVPARLGAGRPVATILQSELA